MSTEVSIFSKDLPAEMRATVELSDLAKSLWGSRSVYVNRRIAVKKGTFRKLNNGDEVGNRLEGPLNVVIVNALPGISRQYYAGVFDPEGEATMPDCWSNLGEIPENTAPNLQSPNCAGCPRNVDVPGKGRECRFQRRIAVILEGDPSGEVYQINLGSKSIFGKGEGRLFPFDAYLKHLITNGESIDRVLTSITIDDNVDYAKVFFSAERHLTDAEVSVATTAGASQEAKSMVMLSSGASTGGKKALGNAAAGSEPSKRAVSKPTIPVPGSTDVSKVVSAWSEE